MSNLKFKHRVNTWEQARDLLGTFDEKEIAYNTRLVRHGDDYQVVHHRTPIVTFHQDGSCTFDAAWVSATTANRMHKCKPEMVDRINRRKGSYVVTLKDHPGTFDMDEGSRWCVTPDRTVWRVR